MAEYLLAEVLERQPEDVRRLLLRTSILEQVTGPLADRLTGDTDGARILDELERASAFVVAIDPARSTFRYHRLFADLLVLELRRTAPDELPALHAAAAEWLAEHGFVVEAIRHAQAARRWDLAARAAVGRAGSASTSTANAPIATSCCAPFRRSVVARDAELAAVAVADELTSGSLGEAARHLAIATRELASVPEERRAAAGGHARDAAPVGGTGPQRRRGSDHGGNAAAVAERRAGGVRPVSARTCGRSCWSVSGRQRSGRASSADAERHLEEALALSRRIGRPLLELGSLSHLALAAGARSPAVAEQRSREAITLAEAHGWRERSARRHRPRGTQESRGSGAAGSTRRRS